ncbi:hypothetical protein [Rouxiella sp. Mn2063]|uniref:hypothetical protein n=1 Tax=Rouxiella sp. Mn2063 TaxID=3395262 RepID=UPI003BE35CF4
MTKPVLMADYHNAVLSALREISWVKSAEIYPGNTTTLQPSTVYFSVENWRYFANADNQLQVKFDANLFIVMSHQNTADSQIAIRTAAAELSHWVEGQQFGLEALDCAVFTQAGTYEFTPAQDDYVVWNISFSQVGALGTDPDESTAAPIKDILLGKAPDIGLLHRGDYQSIYQRKEAADE